MLINIENAPVNSVVTTYTGAKLKILSQTKEGAYVFDLEKKISYLTRNIKIVEKEIAYE